MPLSRHNKTNHHDSASSQLHQPCLVFLRKNLAQHFIAFYIVAFRGKAVASSTNFSCCLLGAQHPTASTKTTKNLRILNLNTSNYQTSPIMSEQKAKEIEMGASKTAEKTKKTASSGGHGDAYSGAISNRAIQKKKTRLNEMNTKRGFDTDTRTACQKKTDSSCMDWGKQFPSSATMPELVCCGAVVLYPKTFTCIFTATP